MSHVVTPAMIKTDKESKSTLPRKKKFSLFSKGEDK
jgi:hypothetical protein